MGGGRFQGGFVEGLKVAAWGEGLEPLAIPGDDDADIRQWLTTKQANVNRLRDSHRQWRVVWIVVAVALAVGLAFVAAFVGEPVKTPALVVGVFFELVLVTAVLLLRARLKELNGDAQVLEYETLLLGLDRPGQRTAANLLFKHQFELKRYYDQNLRQSGHVFALGTLCVLCGLAIVGGTAYLIREDTELAATVATAILGASGALLTGFVARVYIGMYRGSSKSTRLFHERLVTTNRIYLANLLVATGEGNRSVLTECIVESMTSDNNRPT